MSDEFDPAELIELVETITTGEAEPAPSQATAFGLGEGRLIEELYDKLRRYLPIADVQMVITELREQLADGLRPGSLQSLHTTARDCRKCPNASGAILPNWNLTDPDVVFVVENARLSLQGKDHLVRLLKDAGFTSRRIALTWLTRCPSVEVTDTTVTNCQRYLFPELQLLSPKLIVALGRPPVEALLRRQAKVSTEHGQIIWCGPWPIMVSVSPEYDRQRKDQALAADLAAAYRFTYADTAVNRGEASP